MSSPFEILTYGAIQVQIQVGEMTEANMRSFLDSQSQMLEAAVSGASPAARAVLIIDGSVDLVPPATIRRMQADWTNENRERIALLTHAIGFVVPSMAARGAMTAVLWLTRAPWPMETHASLDAAVEWAVGESTRIGAPVDPRLLDLGAAAIEQDRARLAVP